MPPSIFPHLLTLSAHVLRPDKEEEDGNGFAARLKKRTLTKLYNDRPAWLDLAHKNLDAAVFAAYGWDPDMTDDQILEVLLALNLERVGKENSATP